MKPKGPFFGLKLVFLLILLVLAVILIVQNLNSAPIQVFFWGFTAPVIAVIMVSLLIGFLLGMLVLSFAGKKDKESGPERRPDFSSDSRPEVKRKKEK